MATHILLSTVDDGGCSKESALRFMALHIHSFLCFRRRRRTAICHLSASKQYPESMARDFTACNSPLPLVDPLFSFTLWTFEIGHSPATSGLSLLVLSPILARNRSDDSSILTWCLQLSFRHHPTHLCQSYRLMEVVTRVPLYSRILGGH